MNGHSLFADDVCLYRGRIVRIIDIAHDRAVIEFSDRKTANCAASELNKIGGFGRGGNIAPLDNRNR